MKIIKCLSCSRVMHIFPSDTESCIFCSNILDRKNIIDVFEKSPSALKSLISTIDTRIENEEFDAAKLYLSWILEMAPGPALIDMGENIEIVPKSGEIHWRRLLVNLKCKSDIQLLSKGRSLSSNPFFEAAFHTASEIEKPVYLLVQKAKECVFQRLESELLTMLNQIKSNSGSAKITEFKQKLSSVQSITLSNIKDLLTIEKDLKEHEIDITAIINEYKNTVNTIFVSLKTVGDINKAEISENEKRNWVSKVDLRTRASESEAYELKGVLHSNPLFIRFEQLKQEQNTLEISIKDNLKTLNDIKTQIDEKIKSFNTKISKPYSEAIEEMQKGNYALSITKITQDRFDKIVSEVLQSIEL